MQLLRAGGIEPMTDGERVADEDNLEGYFEWEEVKQLPKNPRLIEKAAGKAVKVISALLPSLPAPHRYTVIYMVRPVEQVVDSQWTMLGRRGQSPRSEKRHLIEVQEQHSRQIRKALAASDRVTLLADQKGVRNLFLDGSRGSIRSGRCSAAGRGARRIRSSVKALPIGAIQTRLGPKKGTQLFLRARLRRAGQPETAGSRAPAGAARARAASKKCQEPFLDVSAAGQLE